MPERVEVTTVLYALSLTVVRMLPVAAALVGARLDLRTVAFVGWFGPRGLASLVFALLALEEFGPDAEEAVAVIGVTVFLSVLAHGATAEPLVNRYGRAMASVPEPGGTGARLARSWAPAHAHSLQREAEHDNRPDE